jgi:cell division protease FtsH
MMGIERKKLSMSDKERLHTAIHEAGHAIACYFSRGANKLYKATIVARGGSLGAVIKSCVTFIFRHTWYQMIVLQLQKKKY